MNLGKINQQQSFKANVSKFPEETFHSLTVSWCDHLAVRFLVLVENGSQLGQGTFRKNKKIATKSYL